jgi:Domain of unknown function (DUF4116)
MSGNRPRLKKILDLYGQALSEAIGQRELTSHRLGDKTATSLEVAERETQLSYRDLVMRFARADPTDGKSRTQWLVRTYIQDDKFKLEDLGRVHAALAAFERFKQKLSLEQREINHLKTLFALETLVDPFVKAEAKVRLERDLSTATGRELRRLEEWKARDESIILNSSEICLQTTTPLGVRLRDFRDFELKSRSSRGEGGSLPTIAVPMTEFASKWWGRGTKWCTAAEKDNAFAQYHEDAPLVIIVCSDGEKFQMYVKRNICHFMDNTDEDVSEAIIFTRWSEFRSLFYLAVQQDGLLLKQVPEQYRILEICRLAIQQNGMALAHAPHDLKSSRAFVSKSPNCEDKKTSELCCIAVEQNGLALNYVPENDRTPELCQIAVEQNGWALGYVTKEQKTSELCRIAVQSNGRALYHVPEHEITPELCWLAVEQDGQALAHVPKKHRTPELFRLAIEQDGMALEFVPKDKKTPELCRIAVEQDVEALYYVPDDCITDELCRIAIEQDGMALAHIPEECRTPELCRLALKQNGRVLCYVPHDLTSPISLEVMISDLYQIAVEQNGLALEHVPKKYRTPELCRIAVEQNGDALEYVPEDYKTPNLYQIAVEQNGLALTCVPENKRTSELCCLAVEQDRHALRFVPEEHRKPELMALISPVQPNWHPDILQTLYHQSQPVQDSITKHQDDITLPNPVW